MNSKAPTPFNSPVSFQFVGIECLMTSLVDLFPNFLRKGCRRELLLLAICSVCCLLGLSLVTEVCAARFFHSLPPCFIGLYSCLLYREGCTCCSCWTIMSAVAPLYSSSPSASQSASAGCTVGELEKMFLLSTWGCLCRLSGSHRFWAFLQKHHRHDWISSKSIHEVLLDIHHPLRVFRKHLLWNVFVRMMIICCNKEIVSLHSARC